MRHGAHDPPIRHHSDCPSCRDLAYEPSWYAALAAFVTEDLTIVHREPAPVR